MDNAIYTYDSIIESTVRVELDLCGGSRLADFALLFGERQIALNPLDVCTSGDMGQERRREVSSTVERRIFRMVSRGLGRRPKRKAFDRCEQNCIALHDITLDFIV